MINQFVAITRKFVKFYLNHCMIFFFNFLLNSFCFYIDMNSTQC